LLHLEAFPELLGAIEKANSALMKIPYARIIGSPSLDHLPRRVLRQPLHMTVKVTIKPDELKHSRPIVSNSLDCATALACTSIAATLGQIFIHRAQPQLGVSR
jgi:hypothetical protein